jgi:hypothetical protein
MSATPSLLVVFGRINYINGYATSGIWDRTKMDGYGTQNMVQWLRVYSLALSWASFYQHSGARDVKPSSRAAEQPGS